MSLLEQYNTGVVSLRNYRFSASSETRLDAAHQDLEELAHIALRFSLVDFGVSETARTLIRQRELVNAGASWTMNSRHLLRAPLDGPPQPVAHALDVFAWVDGRVRWDWPLYHHIAAAFKAASERTQIPIEWGGDWSENKKDGPHFQLPWAEYPVITER